MNTTIPGTILLLAVVSAPVTAAYDYPLPVTNTVVCFLNEPTNIPTVFEGIQTIYVAGEGGWEYARGYSCEFVIHPTSALPSTMDHVAVSNHVWTGTNANPQMCQQVDIVGELDYYAITGRFVTAETIYTYDIYSRVDFLYANDETTSHFEQVNSWFLIPDDFSNSASDTNHLGNLAVQTTWSLTNGYVDGFLYAAMPFFVAREDQTLEPDSDFFHIDCGKGRYCIEAKLKDDLDQPIDVAVYAKTESGDILSLGASCEFSLYNTNGNANTTMQRLYFGVTSDTYIIYARVSSPQTCPSNRAYSIRVLQSTPVLLIHGIECYPKDPRDHQVYGRNSMGNWELYLPRDANCQPVECYNFCWDSYTDPLNANKSGRMGEVANCDDNVNPSVAKLKLRHNKNVVVIAHSMGGYIGRCAVEQRPQDIHTLVLIASPQYGSDLALNSYDSTRAWLKQTSEHNIKNLRRASTFVWTIHDWQKGDKIYCIAGRGAKLPSGLKFFLWYSEGIRDGNSDGGVPCSSAIIEGTRYGGKVYEPRDHGTIALATYVDPTCDNYPVCTDPDGIVHQTADKFQWRSGIGPTLDFVFWWYRMTGYHDETLGTKRWDPQIVFKDAVYQDVRNRISEEK